MTDLEVKQLYMAAHVRMNTCACIDRWTAQEIIEAYMTLRPPAVSFEEWSAALGYKTQPATQPSPNITPMREMTPEEIQAANESGVSLLAASGIAKLEKAK